MRVAKTILSLAAALVAGSTILSLSTAAFAWDHDHDRYDHRHWERDHWVYDRPVYVAPRPVVVAPPVVMAPVPVAPVGPPSLNLNMNIPL